MVQVGFNQPEYIALFPQAIVNPFIRPFIYLSTGKDGWRRKDPVCA